MKHGLALFCILQFVLVVPSKYAFARDLTRLLTTNPARGSGLNDWIEEAISTSILGGKRTKDNVKENANEHAEHSNNIVNSKGNFDKTNIH